MEKLKMQSRDVAGGNVERIAALFPHCVTERLDKDVKPELANEETTKTLRTYPDESVHFDTTENLYIEGDNLDVLKVLRETYLGKVKMIY